MVIRVTAWPFNETLPHVTRTIPDARTTRGGIHPLTRAGIWLLFVLALANGAFLYFLPGRALTDYAWAIKPSVNAAFIGAGFLAGTLATGLVLFATRRWRSLATLPPALWVLASTLALATLIHHDKFKFHYLPTWAWVIVYAGVPFVIPFLVWRQRRTSESEPAADPSLNAIRIASAILGVALIAGPAVYYLFPAHMLAHWPWALTPLLTRAVAAWYALFGTMLLTCAVGLRRPAEAFIPYATLAAWCVLLLALPVLYPDQVSAEGPWIAGMVALLALAVLALRRAWPAVRAEGL
jgi:hypothetical protein